MSTKTKAYFSAPVETVLRDFTIDPRQGLDAQRAGERREGHGANRLREARRKRAWVILYDQFKSALAIILTVAAIFSFGLGHLAEGIAIVAVILVNAGIGFISELRAVRSMEALQEKGSPTARVRREGSEKEIPIDEIVPGDIVLHEGGDLVAADMRVLEANALQVDESPLTGESVPVYKTADPVGEGASLAERKSMLYRGTTITNGSGMGVVVATGMDTELGRIAELAESAEEEVTPLEKRLERLGRRMAVLVVVAAAVIALAGLFAGQPTVLMIQTAIALGVAAIPEGLPIASTLALARGMRLMAKRNALINRLAAVESLGATDVIFTDKTGTLTENRMTLRQIVTAEGTLRVEDDGDGEQGSVLGRRVLEIGVLCNNAALDIDGEAVGDPTEIALIRAGRQFQIEREALLERYPEEREESFDPDVKMMATLHGDEDGFRVAVKGAPAAVLDVCNEYTTAGQETAGLSEEERRDWLEKAEALATDGLRVLAMAEKRVPDLGVNPYEGLCLVGLVGLLDPPREGVYESLDTCRRAGVTVVMVTGDAPATARAIGLETGLADEPEQTVLTGSDLGDFTDVAGEARERILNTRIFARVSPEQKLRLMEIYQEAGHVVAMTGDGVNDVPALKKADIGVAMGLRGTDAAREAADMVLKDDSFASIVAAIKQGRIIFGNIRKSVIFMLCTNIAEILVVATASLLGAPLPLRPLQILYLNVLTDVFPALALGLGRGSDRVMDDPPKKSEEAVLDRRHWIAIGIWGSIVAACVLAAFAWALYGLNLGEDRAITMSFVALGMSKLWFVLNLRDKDSTLFKNAILQNRWIWIAVGICILLLVAAVYMPGLSTVLKSHPLGVRDWGIVIGLSLVPMVAGQIYLAVRKPR